MTSEVFKVLRLPRKMRRIVWKRRKSIAPATQNDFWHVVKHVGMSRSATPATQNDMTTSSDTSKKARFCDFSHRHGNFEVTTAADGRLRTVANGCGRLRTLADARSRVTRTRVNPQTPNYKTRTLRYAFGKNSNRKKKQKLTLHQFLVCRVGLKFCVVGWRFMCGLFKVALGYNHWGWCRICWRIVSGLFGGDLGFILNWFRIYLRLV